MALDPSGGGNTAPSVERARHGVERLDALIRRMSEATRLEHAMTDTQRTSLDLAALAKSAVAAQIGAWDSVSLTAVCDPDPLPFAGSADLLLQALDKLMANAKGFAKSGTTVIVRARQLGEAVEICVENEGPALPHGPAQRLFDSMVSERPGPDDGEPHLGLGLYIVRLVARFHGGREFAENLTRGDTGFNGVRIGMRLPRKPGVT
jgi:signal transduction histidine kinase